jgi:hypothetical protein
MVNWRLEMDKTPSEIAEQILPGWKAVRTGGASDTHVDADAQTPSLDALRKAYGITVTKRMEGLVSASGAEEEEAAFVVLEPPAGEPRVGRKVVVVSNGRAIAVQG